MADLRIVDAPVLLQESITDDVKMPTGGLGNFSIRLGDIVWYVVTKEQLANKNYVDTSSKGVKDKLDEHIADKANPHKVTKAQVGLGNVDNTADIDKPVSNATKSAIITATNDMATKNYVDDKNSLKADITYVNSKDGDLTTLTTTNKTSLVKAINEVVSVKANKDDVASSISSLTNNKADKATTLLGYGITDAYTKSEIDTNYGGVKTLYDKNVVAGAGANGWTTDLVLDSTQNKTQSQINSNQEKLNTVLNKIGTTETLAESVDATPFLQSLINAMPDGMTLDLLGKTFRVKKNTGFISDYPKGDQPCLVVKDKKNVRITNGKLIVKEHGQGCFDVLRGSANFEGLVIQGAGNFPPLDGDTGRGEKSTAGTGWFDETMYNAGDPRNNSINTSAYSTGGFGGKFPQWNGGTASTWGVWNGGFIRNYGTGIYCLDSKVDVFGCEIYGFNGSGVDAVGTADVTAERCRIHDNYSCGVWAKAYGDGANKIMPSLTVHNNDIYNIGHPDAKHTDKNIDPGYGIATSNSNAATVGLVNFTATNNRVYHCKRKGIEAHHANNWFVHGNHVDDAGFGIYIGINSGHPFETAIITGNKVKNIYYTDTEVSHGIGVYGLSSATPKKGSVVIHGNEVEEVGIPINPANPALTAAQGRPIIVAYVDSAIITNNKVRNIKTLGNIGISTGVTTLHFIDDSVVNGNIVEGYFQTGIFDRNTDVSSSHICSSNVVDLLSTQPFVVGAQTGIYTDLAETSANIIKVPSDFPTNKRLISSAAPTRGISSGRAINIRVTFNGTANPSITGSSGTDYIASVTSDVNGLAVALKNINATVIFLGVDFVSSNAPSTGVDTLGYIYQRSLFGENGGVLGFKTNGTAVTHISATSLTSGSIEIKLLTT